MRIYRAKTKQEQEARNAKRRERAEQRKREQQESDDVLREQEHNYNAMIEDSIRRYR